MTAQDTMPPGTLARFLATAIDSCGLCLPGQAGPLTRMRSVTLALLQAWSEGDEPAPYRMLCHLVDLLGDRRAISWMVSCDEAWDRDSARTMVGRCVQDLAHAEQRLAVTQALEWLEQPLVLSTHDPASSGEEPQEPASAPALRTPTAKRKLGGD
jgi:hypothetical protein